MAQQRFIFLRSIIERVHVLARNDQQVRGGLWVCVANYDATRVLVNHVSGGSSRQNFAEEAICLAHVGNNNTEFSGSKFKRQLVRFNSKDSLAAASIAAQSQNREPVRYQRRPPSTLFRSFHSRDRCDRRDRSKSLRRQPVRRAPMTRKRAGQKPARARRSIWPAHRRRLCHDSPEYAPPCAVIRKHA